jgi:MoaA/NifB/PqqE/SkfB family radical SAM enzyme
MQPVTALLERLARLPRLFSPAPTAELTVTRDGPRGALQVPNEGDGAWVLEPADDQTPCLTPRSDCHYVYFVLPDELRARAQAGLWLTVEYFGDSHAPFRIQYTSSDRRAPHDGAYKPAEQRWRGETDGVRRFRHALFPLPDFDPTGRQNCGASFRLETRVSFRGEPREEPRVRRVSASLTAPNDFASYRAVAPLPLVKKEPEQFCSILYLFVELTNACNFKCTWCPDGIMKRRRGFMKKEQAFALFDEVAQKKHWLGPLFPVKLHEMGEPLLHPDLPEIVAHAESRGLPIELNTNCSLITQEGIDALYSAGLTHLILSYQTPDASSFRTRKAPRLTFEEYRDKVRLAVERKFALGARTRIEIDVMNTKHVVGDRIVSDEEAAVALLEQWIETCHGIEGRQGLAPRVHDHAALRSFGFLERGVDEGRYTLLEGVDLLWKRLHNWGNAVGVLNAGPAASTYCPAPYEQMVIQWNGDVATCCTDYEGETRVANVFESSVEGVWAGELLKQRRRDMWAGRLLPVCAHCQGREVAEPAEAAAHGGRGIGGA